MPPHVSYAIRDSLVSPDVPPSLGTAFATADVHAHDLTALNPNPAAPFTGWVEGIHIRLTNIVGAATKVYVRMCLDPNGDVTLVPDTEAELAFGITTTDQACAALRVGIPIFGALLDTGTVYLFCKLDAGTADWNNSCITWKA